MPDIRKLTDAEQIQVLEVKIYEYVMKVKCMVDIGYWQLNKRDYKMMGIPAKYGKKKIRQAYENLFEKRVMGGPKCGYDSFGIRTFEGLFRGFVLKYTVMKDKKLREYI
jgi:hypothetical protein